MKSNPFFELYVGDRISSREFVTIFSPKLVPHTEALFLPGNIVVTGIQGCGKSMLLSLLKPRVRLEYENAREEFPVPMALRKFICGSVNLAHSNAIDFGYRSSTDDDPQKIELIFGDFLNYLLVDSILGSLQVYAGSPTGIRREVGLNVEAKNLDQIAPIISNLPVWEGWLGTHNSFATLREKLQHRIRMYRRYVHRKDKELSPDLFDTSTSIGAPLIDLAQALHACQAIDSDTKIFADIDQYEELGNISSRNTPGKDVDYRAVINKALASRSPHISYRIGTRGHSWRRHGRIHGTNGSLELERHYKYIDLDLVMQKDEFDSQSAKSVFKDFASDVFARRLRFADYSVPDNTGFKIMESVYGKDLSAEEKVNTQYGLRDPERIIRTEPGWSSSSQERLKSLARHNLFSAKLGEVWLRQKGDAEDLTMRDELLPWQRVSNRWWRKERSQILAIQIASQANQKTVWGGAGEVLELSGGSILAFLSLNQFIWSVWLQRSGQIDSARVHPPSIDLTIQSVGVQKASIAWVELIAEQSGRSGERMRFVKAASSILRKRLMEDRKLSYPGANGFSLSDEELDQIPSVRRFLEELADYGNLLMLDHTSKLKDKKTRKKFYFNPIFCPSFGIPYVRTKEPYYAKISEVAEWVQQSGYPTGLRTNVDNSHQQTLI